MYVCRKYELEGSNENTDYKKALFAPVFNTSKLNLKEQIHSHKKHKNTSE